ncbi:MAG: hypothetical protein ACI9IP_002833 [Arcticibacterium sp.]|jgi:hypothetical protein
MKSAVTLSLLLLIQSCTFLGIDPDIEKISFKPTQCANPWDVSVLAQANPTPEEKLKTYLGQGGISEVFDFQIKTDNGSYCEACHCEGRETYTFSIKKEELSILKSIEPFDTKLK